MLRFYLPESNLQGRGGDRCWNKWCFWSNVLKVGGPKFCSYFVSVLNTAFGIVCSGI